jgi:hypothetical protein
VGHISLKDHGEDMDIGGVSAPVIHAMVGIDFACCGRGR